MSSQQNDADSSRFCGPNNCLIFMPPIVKEFSDMPSKKEHCLDQNISSSTKGRRHWKTFAGVHSSELIWPPKLEAVLIEALEEYDPVNVSRMPVKKRWPMRNKFISDYIFIKTGKDRTPKQVGSWLQHLQLTSKKEKVRNLIVNDSFFISTLTGPWSPRLYPDPCIPISPPSSPSEPSSTVEEPSVSNLSGCPRSPLTVPLSLPLYSDIFTPISPPSSTSKPFPTAKGPTAIDFSNYTGSALTVSSSPTRSGFFSPPSLDLSTYLGPAATDPLSHTLSSDFSIPVAPPSLPHEPSFTVKELLVLDIRAFSGSTFTDPLLPTLYSDIFTPILSSLSPNRPSSTVEETFFVDIILPAQGVWFSQMPSINWNGGDTPKLQSVHLALSCVSSTFHRNAAPLYFLSGEIEYISPVLLNAQTTFTVYSGNATDPIHVEHASLKFLFASSNQSRYHYLSLLVPKFWAKLSSSRDPTQYIVHHTTTHFGLEHPHTPSYSRNDTTVVKFVYRFINSMHSSSESSSQSTKHFVNAGDSPGRRSCQSALTASPQNSADAINSQQSTHHIHDRDVTTGWIYNPDTGLPVQTAAFLS